MKNCAKILLIPLILMFTVTAAEASKPIKARIDLTAAGSDTDAKGFAAFSFKEKKKKKGNGPTQSFQIKVEKVASSTNFMLLLDGTVIDAFTTTPGGTFEAIYEPNPKGSHRLLLPSITDVTKIKLVEVKNSLTGEVVLNGTFGAQGGDDEEIERNIKLNPTAVDPDAKGDVKIEIEKEDGNVEKKEFELEVENLASSTGFKLFVNGVDVFTFGTDANGKAKLVFSNDPEGSEQPFPPGLTNLENITLIEIKTLGGQVVLTSAVPPPVGAKTATLTSTGIIPNATGKADLNPSGNANLKVQVSNLPPLTVFLVRVDGRLAGGLNTDSNGAASLELATDGKSGSSKLPLPLSILPSTAKLVDVINEAGLVVLSGMFP